MCHPHSSTWKLRAEKTTNYHPLYQGESGQARHFSWGHLGVAFGAVIQVGAGHGDVFSHRILFQEEDPWWNPMHLTLYVGILIVVLALLRSGTRRRSGLESGHRLGYRVAYLGVGTQVVAGVWNEIQHRFLGSEPRFAPAHALLVVGMVLLVLSSLTILSTDYLTLGRARPAQREMALLRVSLVAVFAAVWLLAAGSAIWLGGITEDVGVRMFLVAALGATGPLVILPALYLFGRFGYATAIGTVYTAFNLLMIVGFAGAELYLPFGLLAPAFADLAFLEVRRRVGRFMTMAVIGGLLGLLVYPTHYPYTPYVFGVETLLTLDVYMALAAVGGLIAATIAWLVLPRASNSLVDREIPWAVGDMSLPQPS
ncbi:MAG: hypothetical protein ACE5KH_06440 [Candidatus Geothermarchaeales archaeon]